jgi:acyl-CoA synthetase (NDP forming)
VDQLRRSRVPDYRFPEEAASAAYAMARYRLMRDAPQGKPVKFRVNKSAAARVIAAARRARRKDLGPSEVAKLLEAYGFPLAPARTVGGVADAIAAAQHVGYPVVLKVASDKISHKTDVGGVKVDLRNADEVGEAFRGMVSKLKRRDPELRITVQKMVPGGKEVILGMARDSQFGPLILFGLGGVFVEVMRDVKVRIHPLTDVAARTMVEQVKGYAILKGTRGDKGVDIALIEECLLRLSQLVGDFEDDLEEMDLNPFILTHRRARSAIVDARIRLT